MITTENFEIEKTEDLTASYIENCLAQKGIEPLRWAIVDTTDENLIVSVSYKKFNKWNKYDKKFFSGVLIISQ